MKSDLLYVEHILECIRRIEEYTGGQRDLAALVPGKETCQLTTY
jgi:hypothetical protein